MNGVMPNLQYMPSPHGLPKQILLHHTAGEFSSNVQAFDQHEYSNVNKENNNEELYKTTRIWMGDSKVTNRGHAFPLASTVESCFDSDTGLPNKDQQTAVGTTNTNLKRRHMTGGKYSSCFTSIRNDDSGQTVRHCKTDIKNETRTESVKSSLDVKDCSFVSGICEEINVVSMERRIEFDMNPTVSDNFTSDLVPRSHCKRPLENEPSEDAQESCKSKEIPALLSPSVNISRDLVETCKPHLCKNETKVAKRAKTSQCDEKAESNANLYSDSIESKECNVNCEFSVIGETDKDKSEPQNVLSDILNSENRISRNIDVNVSRRLPDYKQFSNVIQKAMQNVKRHRNYFENISPVKSTQSNETFTDASEIYKLKSGTENNHIITLQLNVLKDMDKLDDFFYYVNSKISELIFDIRSIGNDIQLLHVHSEDISVALHYIQNAQFVNENDLVTRTRDEMQKLGGHLLKRLVSLEHNWINVLTEYRHNLVIVSKYMYTLCSIPMETKVIDERDYVFGLVDKMDKLIQDIEIKEKELDVQRTNNFSVLVQLQREIKKFHDMDNLAEDFC